MAVPKRRTTRAKSKMRRAQHDKVTPVNLSPCTNCGEPVLPHRVCPSCGFYKGAKVTNTKLGVGAVVLRDRGPLSFSHSTMGADGASSCFTISMGQTALVLRG